ncbi:MAG: ferritin-like domain-containing protein [Gammaproteobacteria bacterium AqS3]|nr:ferritin-like domain-containing protein [Gammaproteobacteria bacterium AqS3]
MKIKYIDHHPTEVLEEFGGVAPGESDFEQINEIFQTPLTGAYNWDYTLQDNRIKKLYELGKELNWNAETDLDWEAPFGHDQRPTDPIRMAGLEGWEPYDALSEEQKVRFAWGDLSQSLSQFLHGEQGALLVASQLVSCAPTYNAKLYAASQTFDEARHVEVFNKYLQVRCGMMYPINDSLKLLLDKILTDERWDLKFIGMQIIIEGLALAAFSSLQATAIDPLLKNLLHYVLRDEARHVTFGVNYLEEFVETLSEEEKADRAEFAYEACVVMRNRMRAGGYVFEQFGLDPQEGIARQFESPGSQTFRTLLFARVIPNLKRIGLLTEEFRQPYEELGVLSFEEYDNDGVLNWEDLSKPYTRVA